MQTSDSKKWGKTIESGKPECQVAFDNVNENQKSWDASLGHADVMRSGTAATVIKLEDVPPGALKTAPVLEAVAKGVRAELTPDDL